MHRKAYTKGDNVITIDLSCITDGNDVLYNGWNDWSNLSIYNFVFLHGRSLKCHKEKVVMDIKEVDHQKRLKKHPKRAKKAQKRLKSGNFMSKF